MDHLLNFTFVLVNSAYLIPAVATFMLLGFALGYFTWAKSARQWRELKAQVDELESRYDQTLSEADVPVGSSVKPALATAAAGGFSGLGNSVAEYGSFSKGTLLGLGMVGKRFAGEEGDIDYSEEFGALYTVRPRQVDDLTELAGIDSRTADQMNDLGVYTFKQIETLNPRQRKVYETKFHLTDLTWKTPISLPSAELKQAKISNPIPLVGRDIDEPRNPRVESAIAEMGEIGNSFRGEEDRLIWDDELGLVYYGKPDIVDDLTVLKGIDAVQAEEMNQAGVFCFKQLEVMNNDQRFYFEERFDLKEIKWERWGLQLGWGGVGNSPVGFGKMIKDQLPES